jgi:hypothetical protein
MSNPVDRSGQELERDWQALITHTKIASRSAYRAALIMAAQNNLLAAQGLMPEGAEQTSAVSH